LSPKRSASEGTRKTAPRATLTMSETSVEWPAAASSIVSPGRKVGLCAKPQPAMIAATAIAAVARAGS
jgi:hypothetical protein